MVALCAASVQADELKVAAANNMAFVIKDLAANFERTTGNKISVSLGSSGNFGILVAVIVGGASSGALWTILPLAPCAVRHPRPNGRIADSCPSDPRPRSATVRRARAGERDQVRVLVRPTT